MSYDHCFSTFSNFKTLPTLMKCMCDSSTLGESSSSICSLFSGQTNTINFYQFQIAVFGWIPKQIIRALHLVQISWCMRQTTSWWILRRQHIFIGDDNGSSSFMHFCGSNPEITQMKQHEKEQHQLGVIKFMLLKI